MYCTPFRAIHPGGAYGICGKARVYGNVCLIGKRVDAVRGNPGVADTEFDPLSGTVSVEPCDIKATGIKILVAYCHAVGSVCVARAPGCG